MPAFQRLLVAPLFCLGLVAAEPGYDLILTNGAVLDGESALRPGGGERAGRPDDGEPWPFGAHLAALEEVGRGLNVTFLTGHNAIRRTVLMPVDRALTAATA